MERIQLKEGKGKVTVSLTTPAWESRIHRGNVANRSGEEIKGTQRVRTSPARNLNKYMFGSKVSGNRGVGVTVGGK